MRRLVLFCLFFGAVGLFAVGEDVGWAVALVGAVGAVAEWCRWPGNGAAVLAWALVGAVAGWLLYSTESGRRAGREPVTLANTGSVVLRGMVSSLPDERAEEVRFILALRGGAVGRLMASCRKTEACPVEPGDLVTIRGKLEALPAPLNAYEFDYGAWLARRGIEGTVQVEHLSVRAGRGSAWLSLLRPVQALRRQVGGSIARAGWSSENRAIVSAMLLGRKDLLQPYLRETFAIAGAAHLLAVSGLHLGCVAAAVLLLTSLPGMLGLRAGQAGGLRRARLALAWLCSALFLALSGAPTSCVRAFIMLSGYAVAQGIGRDYDIWSWLAASALLILAWRPGALLEAGFQLSTVSVAAIAAVVGRWRGRERSLTATPVRPALARVARYLGALALVAAAAFAGTMPLVWYHFANVAPLSVPANVVAVPVVSFITLPAAMLYAVLEGWVPWVPEVLAWSVDNSLLVVRSFLELIAACSGRWSPRWPGWIVAAMLSGLMLGALVIRGPRNKTALAACVGVIILALALRPGGDGSIRGHVFHCGDGDALLLVLGDGQTVMVDGGSPGCGRRALLPLFRREGIRVIDHLFLTHGHQDHWAGLLEVAGEVTLKQVYTSGTPLAQGAVGYLRRALGEGEDPEEEPTILCAGDNEVIGDVRFDVHWPPAGAERQSTFSENDLSLVLDVSAGEFSLVLTGDVELEERPPEVTNELLDSISSQRREVLLLKAPNHGRRSPLLPLLVERLSPTVTAVTAAPDHVWREGLLLGAGGAAGPCHIWVTGDHGAFSFRMGEGEVSFRAYGREVASYSGL